MSERSAKRQSTALQAGKGRAGSIGLWTAGIICGALLCSASLFQQEGIALGTGAGKAGFLTAIYIVLVPLVNLFLWDITDTDRERHRAFTGVYTDLILSNLTLVAKAGARVRVRCILVNGVNTNTAHYRAVAEIAASVQNLDGVELIPYHAYGGGKATFLGRPDNGDPALIPTEAQKAEAAEVLRALGVRVL